MKKLIIILLVFITISLIQSCKKNDLCNSNSIEFNGECIDKADINYFGKLNFKCYNDSIVFALYTSESKLIFKHYPNGKFRALASSGTDYSKFGSENYIICGLDTSSLSYNRILIMPPIAELQKGIEQLNLKAYFVERRNNEDTRTDSITFIVRKR
jgi:hypothetical protein